MYVWCLKRTEEGIGSAGTVVIDACEVLFVLGTEPQFSKRADSALNH